jgi:hypothetical protein
MSENAGLISPNVGKMHPDMSSDPVEPDVICVLGCIKCVVFTSPHVSHVAALFTLAVSLLELDVAGR